MACISSVVSSDGRVASCSHRGKNDPLVQQDRLLDNPPDIMTFQKFEVSDGGRIMLFFSGGRRMQLTADHFGGGQYDLTEFEAGRLLCVTVGGDNTLLHRLTCTNADNIGVDEAACIHALLNRARHDEADLGGVASIYAKVSEAYRRAGCDEAHDPDQRIAFCEEAAVIAMQAAQSYELAKRPLNAAASYEQVASAYRLIAEISQMAQLEEGSLALVKEMHAGASKLAYKSYRSTLDEEVVDSDGNCFFEALNKSGDLGRGASTLRSEAVRELRSNEGSYAPFVVGNDVESLALKLVREGEWEKGDIVPYLLANVLRRPIRILDKCRETVFTVHPSASDGGEPITIFYNGTSHYNAAVPNQAVELTGDLLSHFSDNVCGSQVGRERKISGTVSDRYDLSRFVNVQASTFNAAIKELRNGCKESHWMWYMFPQLKGLGMSDNAKRFAIGSLSEAISYLSHPELGKRITEMTEAVNQIKGRSIQEIFGVVDAMKFHSSMTLFSMAAADSGSVFATALEKYFGGKRDEKTVDLLNARLLGG